VAISLAPALIGAPSEEEATVLEAARGAYDARIEPGKAEEAWQLYRSAAAEDPSSYEAHWGAARAAWYLGDVEWELAGDADRRRRLQLYEEGMRLAERAVALRPDGAEGHLWAAIVFGAYGQTRGLLKSLFMLSDIRDHAERALELDPSVDGHAPDRVLGRMYFKLPWFKGGDNQRSLGHLERSLRGTPTHAYTRVYLAEVLRAEGRRLEAIDQLRHVVSMEPDPRWEGEHRWAVRRARELLARWD
jgi:tetratricopeptide (TPR) repeat protein